MKYHNLYLHPCYYLNILVFVLVSCAKYDSSFHNFPCMVDYPSPNGKYTLNNVDADSDKQANEMGANHLFYVTNNETGQKEQLFGYDHGGSVLWLRDSNSFIVNITEASNFKNIYIYFYNNGWKKYDFWEELQKDSSRKALFDISHIYLKFQNMLNNKSLIFIIDGWAGDKVKSYEGEFKCTFNQSEIKINCLKQEVVYF